MATKITKPQYFDMSVIPELQFYESGVHAGFPSPATDFTEHTLDFTKDFIPHPDFTFYARVRGDSMKDEGIHDGDIAVIDRSEEPRHGNLVVAMINGEFILKRLHKKNNRILLIAANPVFKAIEITEGEEFTVWGVVRMILKSTL